MDMIARSSLSKLAGLAIAELLALSGCGGGPPPEPQNASSEASDGASPPKETEAQETEARASEPASQPPPKKDNRTDSIPDDYTITQADCAQLGKQFAVVTRADQKSQLSPKLADKQREQAEKSIDEAATKMGEGWTESCQNSLVGKVAESKRLSCALAARTVKAFDACINGEPPP